MEPRIATNWPPLDHPEGCFLATGGEVPPAARQYSGTHSERGRTLSAPTTESNSAGTWTQTGSRVNHCGSDGDDPQPRRQMSVRLYDPSSGRFLQVDPVAGGSCNVMKHGRYRPPYREGPGSIYNKVRRYLSRN